jgi:hypothetical protein
MGLVRCLGAPEVYEVRSGLVYVRYAAAVSISPRTKKPDLGLLMSGFAQGFGAAAFAR